MCPFKPIFLSLTVLVVACGEHIRTARQSTPSSDSPAYSFGGDRGPPPGSFPGSGHLAVECGAIVNLALWVKRDKLCPWPRSFFMLACLASDQVGKVEKGLTPNAACTKLADLLGDTCRKMGVKNSDSASFRMMCDHGNSIGSNDVY